MSRVKSSEPSVRIHYLGHASFVLRFGDDLTVLTDYGSYNAWAEWGWNSPIYDFRGLTPDVTTYSHTHHKDHYDESRKPENVRNILTGTDRLDIGGVEILPIRTSETSLYEEDNSSFLFTYKGMKILHLGNCQANIMKIETKNVEALFPDRYDLLLMPIEGREKFIREAEIFLRTIGPKQIIPMHYWSNEYKSEFLKHLRKQSGIYRIEETAGADYALKKSDYPFNSTKVVSVEPAPFLTQ